MQHIKICAMAAAAALCQAAGAQTVTFDTEDYAKVGVYDTWEKSPFRTGELRGNVKVVDNPDQDGYAGGKVLAVQRSRFGSNTFGARIDLKEPFKLSTKARKVEVMIHRPVEGRVMLIGLGKRRDRAGQSKETEQFWVKSATSVKPNQWQKAVFEFKGSDSVDIHSLVVVPHCESTHDMSGDFAAYIDGIQPYDSKVGEGDYPLNFDHLQTYTREDRGLTGVRLGTKTITASSNIKAGETSSYTDKMAYNFSVKAGETVTPAVNYKGSWMNAYAYVDFGKDGGFSFGINADGTPAQGSDLVAYSHYNGKNSKGAASGGDNLSMPSFTVPAGTQPGFYRMRYKVDWDNINPGGNPGDENGGNFIIANGGGIVDVLLNVHADEVSVTNANRNGMITLADGTPLSGYTAPFGKSIKIKATPSGGFICGGIRIRHGYGLEGDSLVYGTPQYFDILVDKSKISKDGTYTIPSSYVDGDLLIEGLFEEVKEEDEPQETAYYPINFDKDAKRTNSSRWLNGISLGANSAQVADKSLMYHDLTATSFVAKAGQKATPLFDYNSGWMNGYVYIDTDKDGAFNAVMPEADGTNAEGSELMTFSHLSVDGKGINSAGENVDGSVVNPPTFTIPATLADGFYMMRYTVDWDCLEPGGRMTADNDIFTNGGAVADVRLRIMSDGKVAVSATADHGTLRLHDGTPLDGQSVNAGEPFSIMATPDDGYKLESIRLRHGILSGDSIVGGVAQYADHVFPASALSGGMLFVPGNMADGDMVFTAKYVAKEQGEQPEMVWEMIFNDEFNQPDGTFPDPAKWSTTERNPGATWARYIKDDPSVAFIRDNCLVTRCIPNPDISSDNVEMISGAKETQDKFSFTYGKMEVRVKTNHHVGNFPAAWLMPQPPTKGWPSGGEIDVFETIDSQDRAWHTVHSHWTYDLGKTWEPQSSANIATSVTDWHVYGIEWDANEIKWFIDGNQTFSYAKSSDSNALANGQWPFDAPFYIILNQSVGNGVWAQWADTGHTYETLFDWVRVYQKVEATGISSVKAGAVDGNIYDLSGRRVEKPAHGVYVKNGRKFVVK